MNRIEMGVLAEETDGENFGFRLSFDGDYHTLHVFELDEAWRFTFDFHDKTAGYVLKQLDQVMSQLAHFVDGDVGGPTPELVRHKGAVQGGEDEKEARDE